MIHRLRRYLPWHGVEEPADQLSDREILNVFRYSEETMLETKEISESLPITQEWTHERLERLENNGRVESRTFAANNGPDRHGGVDVWRLSPEETTSPVPVNAVDIGWWIYQANRHGKMAFRLAALLLMTGGLILIPTFFLFASTKMNSLIFHEELYAAAAMAAALTAALFLIGGGVITLFAMGLRHFVE